MHLSPHADVPEILARGVIDSEEVAVPAPREEELA